jgi:hypothetical protein
MLAALVKKANYFFLYLVSAWSPAADKRNLGVSLRISTQPITTMKHELRKLLSFSFSFSFSCPPVNAFREVALGSSATGFTGIAGDVE